MHFLWKTSSSDWLRVKLILRANYGSFQGAIHRNPRERNWRDKNRSTIACPSMRMIGRMCEMISIHPCSKVAAIKRS